MTCKKITLLFIFCFFLLASIGCDAFVRKFTRKSKKDSSAQEEMVLAPIEYKAPQMSKEELYRQNFLYWKSWQDELIEALLSGKNHKKQLDCTIQAIKNLEQIKIMLRGESQKKLDNYIQQLINIKQSVERDLYGSNVSGNRLSAERMKMEILKEFSYAKIKGDLL